ncbi:PAS domain-containing sensor histidine kinase [Flagellimonas marinaquae]|nr:PAS domain-containing sensor histidine kinase [Allomuricauda aquimarina]
MSEINPFLNYGATSLENLKDFCRKTVQEKIDAAACRKDMVWTMDKDYKLTGFNDLFYQRLKKENIDNVHCGMDLQGIFKDIPFFRVCIEGCKEVFDHSAPTSRFEISEKEMGQIHEFSFHPVMIAPGKVTECYICQRDITRDILNVLNLEDREYRYREVQEVASLGHWVWDIDKDEISWSDQLYTIWAKDHERFVANYDSVVAIIHQDDRMRFIEHLEDCLQGRATHDITHRIVLDSGEEKYIHTKGNLFRDASGKPIRMSGTAQDVTKEIRSHHKILDQNLELQNFVRIVSHNLRAPISNLLMLSKIYEWGQDKTNDDIVKNIESSTLALDHTIRDLNNSLSFKRTLRERVEEIHFKEILKDVRALLYSEIKATKASIAVDFTTVSNIYSIKSYVSNILYNLLVNALKYSKEDIPPKIVVSTEEKKDWIILKVSDNGIGMELTPERKSRIFDMYGRLSAKTKGKGMGLFLVKTQIEALNGSIDVISEKGMGSTFIVSFRK